MINHTLYLFGQAFLLSAISAGSSMLISEGDSSDNDPSNVVRNEIGRQFGQLGVELVRQRMQNIKPTIEIRPGYRFNVMVNKDLILQPYQN